MAESTWTDVKPWAPTYQRFGLSTIKSWPTKPWHDGEAELVV